ncbi:hypothetical protein D5086_021756 [Populus alba]|uniref:Uncharacterized protein n=1 Tax=Populus alba TaxID=43335 RepID=A0ACC4BD42_POPAL
MAVGMSRWLSVQLVLLLYCRGEGESCCRLGWLSRLELAGCGGDAVNVLWHFHRRNGEVSGFMRILILDGKTSKEESLSCCFVTVNEKTPTVSDFEV